MNNDDPIGLFDPLLSAVSPKENHAHFRGGYKIWPGGDRIGSVQARLMCIGNSTSLWPAAAWSRELGMQLTHRGRPVAIYNGAGKGNTSSQEVLRILRDVPGIRPDLVVSLSGICDIGYLLNARHYPFMHKYTRRVMDFAKQNGLVDDVVYGYPNDMSPAQSWCMNQRAARALADEYGVAILVFLQPVMGYGRYYPSVEEEELYRQKGAVVLKSANKPYRECLVEFYDEVRSIMSESPGSYGHVVDFTDAFADCPGAYRDHRHQSKVGVAHLATKMLPLVDEVLSARANAAERHPE